MKKMQCLLARSMYLIKHQYPVFYHLEKRINIVKRELNKDCYKRYK